MTDPARKKKTVTVRMTAALYANLKRTAGTDRQIAEVVREAS